MEKMKLTGRKYFIENKMKKKLLIVLIVLTGRVVFAENKDDVSDDKKSPSTINALDTVVFDLSKAVITGSYVEFPVSFKSDDVVNALDFSMKYNHANFLYDSVLNHTYYLTSSSLYNTTDQTIRFTSNSFHVYTHDTALVTVRFTMLNGTDLCSSDLNSITAYLNGDPCSFKVTNCLSAGIKDEKETDDLIKVYPNPANDFLNVEVPEKATFQLFDITGKQIVFQTNVNQKQEINIQNIANGIYLVRIFNDKFSSFKKIVVNK